MTARWAAISARAALRSAWTCFAAWARSCRASASLSAPASAAMAGPARTRQASAALRAAGSFFTRAKAEVGSFNMYRSGKRRQWLRTASGQAGVHHTALQRQEFLGLHLVQARYGTGELMGQRALSVKLLGRHGGRDDQLDPAVVDRKSTRLNSSHLVISYAVFCLKKKKTATHASARSTGSHLSSSPLTS